MNGVKDGNGILITWIECWCEALQKGGGEREAMCRRPGKKKELNPQSIGLDYLVMGQFESKTQILKT